MYQLAQIIWEYPRYSPGAHFSKILNTFGARKAVLCLSSLHARLKFQNFSEWYNETISYHNKEKLTGLWARNYATIPQVSILKFAFGPGKFPRLPKNRPPISCSPPQVNKF